MKKKVTAIFTVLCLTLFVGDFTVQAANEKYCPHCASVLNVNGANQGHWSSTHWVDTDLYAGTTPVKELCTISYSVDRIYRTCPNGCYSTTDDMHYENHSSAHCTDKATLVD